MFLHSEKETNTNAGTYLRTHACYGAAYAQIIIFLESLGERWRLATEIMFVNYESP